MNELQFQRGVIVSAPAVAFEGDPHGPLVEFKVQATVPGFDASGQSEDTLTELTVVAGPRTRDMAAKLKVGDVVSGNFTQGFAIGSARDGSLAYHRRLITQALKVY